MKRRYTKLIDLLIEQDEKPQETNDNILFIGGKIDTSFEDVFLQKATDMVFEFKDRITIINIDNIKTKDDLNGYLSKKGKTVAEFTTKFNNSHDEGVKYLGTNWLYYEVKQLPGKESMYASFTLYSPEGKKLSKGGGSLQGINKGKIDNPKSKYRHQSDFDLQTILQRTFNLGQKLQESLSRGSLYRKRYYGRY